MSGTIKAGQRLWIEGIDEDLWGVLLSDVEDCHDEEFWIRCDDTGRILPVRGWAVRYITLIDDADDDELLLVDVRV